MSKLGGGLHYIDGPQGHGKSYYSVRRIRHTLEAGKYVVTNVKLTPGWSERMARHHPLDSLLGNYKERQRRYESLYVYTEELGDVFRFNVPGIREARALCVWDESHNDLNNREWNKDGRDVLLKGATQLRKLGFSALLVTQHQNNTDAALRRVAGWRVRMTNVREHTRVLGLRVIPFHFFIAAYFPANTLEQSPSPSFYERFFLRWDRRLYDSMGIYSGLYEDLLPLGDRIDLPPAGRAMPPQGERPPTGSPARLGRWWHDLDPAKP